MRALQMAVGIVAAAALGAAAPPASAMIECGMASWYGLEAGATSADGGSVDPSALAAAHRSLPFGTRVRVENLSNGRATTVVINDRGPFTGGRVIDVTRAAAEELAFIDGAIARVRISTLGEAADGELGQIGKTCP